MTKKEIAPNDQPFGMSLNKKLKRGPISETFTDLIDVMDIAVWELDMQYRVVACNQKAKKIYGETAIGNYCYKVAAKRDAVCDQCPAEKIYIGHQSGRSQHKRTDISGNTIYIDHIATPIIDSQGTLSGVLVLIIDITKQKLMENEIIQHRDKLEEIIQERTGKLKESRKHYRKLYARSKREEELYRSLLESSADAIVIYDMDGSALFVNSSFTQTFGWQFKELKGARIPFVPESEKEITLHTIQQVIHSGKQIRRFNTRRLTKDGRILDVEISASRYNDHKGKPAGMLVVLRDNTHAKALEIQLRQSQKMEAIGTLAGGVAHDFNNILMGIQGRASLLMSELDPGSNHLEHLAGIEAYVKSATDLTRQLLGFARGGKYQVQAANLNQIIETSARMFGRTRKEIRIHMDFEPELWNVEIDKQQIEQVLLNLYVNSWQAMPGGGDFYLRTKNIEIQEDCMNNFRVNPGRYVKVELADTGVGMDPGILQKVFDPFFTTKERGRGTGLGLASAYGIVKNHNGLITVHSEKGKGATFNIYLPATTDKIAPDTHRTTRTLTGEETVLILDDEQMVLDVAKPMLEKLGYKVYVAASGEQAISIYQRHRKDIHLVILDMIMPGMTGGQVYDRLRQINPKIKALLSSGYSINGQATEILSRGCNGFLQKPFGIGELSRKVRSTLDE